MVSKVAVSESQVLSLPAWYTGTFPVSLASS